jgi:hypothetical protein
MSETEQEVTPPEPDEPDEAAQDEEDEANEEGEPAEATPEPEPEPEAARDDADVNPVYAKLDTKAANYIKGVSDLMKDGAIPAELCEMCADCYPGLRWVKPSDEMHATLLAVVGASESGSPLNNDPDAILCDRCNGFGHTKLPSHVPGNDSRLCRACNGAGWLERNAQSGAPQAPVPAPANGNAEPMPGVPESDPSVVDLRSRGFTVIPPMTIAGAAEQA